MEVVCVIVLDIDKYFNLFFSVVPFLHLQTHTSYNLGGYSNKLLHKAVPTI